MNSIRRGAIAFFPRAGYKEFCWLSFLHMRDAFNFSMEVSGGVSIQWDLYLSKYKNVRTSLEELHPVMSDNCII